MTPDDERRLKWIAPEKRQFTSREELDREFERPDSKLTLEQYREAHDALPWRSENPSALGVSAKRPPAPERPAPVAPTSSERYTLAQVDAEKFIGGLQDWVAAALRPLHERIAELEKQNRDSTAAQMTEHKLGRHSEHLARLQTRVAQLELALKRYGLEEESR